MKESTKKGPPSVGQLEAKDAGDALLNVIKVGAFWFLPFFRHHVGDRYYTMGAFSLLTMLPMLGDPLMWGFLPLWLLALLCSRVDRREHSHWGGYSRLRFRNQRTARLVEPFVVLAMGIALMAVDEAFAAFTLAGGSCMFLLAAYDSQQENQLRRRMRDDGLYANYMGRIRRGE